MSTKTWKMKVTPLTWQRVLCHILTVVQRLVILVPSLLHRSSLDSAVSNNYCSVTLTLRCGSDGGQWVGRRSEAWPMHA